MAKGRTKRFLLTGLATLLPTMLTIVLLVWVGAAIHDRVGAWVNKLLESMNIALDTTGWAVVVGDAIALLVFLALCWVTGFLVATYFGGLFFRRLDKWFRHVPLIRIVYPALKQVSDFFLAERTAFAFTGRVVAVPYPRPGVYSLGFATGPGLSQITTHRGDRLMCVFIPNSPAPLTGFTIFVPREDVIAMNLSVDEAIKLIVSGGVVVPDREVAEPQYALGGGPDVEPAKPTLASDDDNDEPSEDA
jgi:uncharacterized membrane protein